ncbi:hypothetical protein AMATHDRAFT_138444 [Amanita thiersii Skay4041]|uniref:Uncharacterized protein n=1 Tax=Amanita thiersii Skay4041 TaxID=703135 RepID=A0A2A9NYS1_9AGAR|nr:hypothetical protein AMATHDRAFT_138444 [Amanita thiersii Skay4041]
MQKECALLYNTMNQELEEIRTLALEANRKREQLGKSRYGSRQKQDLGDSAKWGLIDAVQFGNVLKQYKHDLLALKEQRDQLKQKVRQIQSRMLKAGTRKEEISRFTKAQSDKEFARMLKTRTLGPEHLETQAQLRKNIRMIRDRIQKLEANLSTYKKKLAEASSGKPSFRPPTLDTISRAYRNIGLAIQHKSDEVTELSARVAELKVTTPMKIIPSKRDPRLPDNDSRRPFNVTRHVAVTTAAALNAERSAQKLKKALLTVRKQPLLNKKAVHASAAPIAFKTPLKIESTTEERKIAENFFMTPIKGPLFDPVTTPPSSVPDLTFPEDEFEPSPSPSTRRGAGRTKKHSSVPLKRSTGTPPAAAAPTFDWGPLPTFNQPPLGGLPSPLKPTSDPPGFVSFAQFKK